MWRASVKVSIWSMRAKCRLCCLHALYNSAATAHLVCGNVQIENEVADGMCERENKEHDDDSDYDSEYDEDNDWDNRMDEATTHAQQKAVEQWCKSQMQNPWAMEEVPRRLQQHVPAEMKLAHQALLDGIAARMQR